MCLFSLLVLFQRPFPASQSCLLSKRGFSARGWRGPDAGKDVGLLGLLLTCDVCEHRLRVSPPVVFATTLIDLTTGHAGTQAINLQELAGHMLELLHVYDAVAVHINHCHVGIKVSCRERFSKLLKSSTNFCFVQLTAVVLINGCKGFPDLFGQFVERYAPGSEPI